MKIGKLSDFLPINYRWTAADRQETIAEGIPAEIKWNALWDMGLELHLSLPQSCFIDRLILSVGEKAQLQRVTRSDTHGILAVYAAETGKTVTVREIPLEVAAFGQELTLRIESFYSDLLIEDIALYGAVEEGLDLFPTPEHSQWSGESVAAAAFTGYSTDTPLSRKAEAVLAEKFAEETGITLQPQAGGIVFTADPAIPANGYRVTVENKKITLCAADERGFVLAAECLIKLTEKGQIKVCTVADAPAHPLRGVHIYLPAIEEVDFTKRLIKYLFSPLGYNMIIFEVAFGMQFDSHPEINAITMDAIAKGKAGLMPPFPHGVVAGGACLPKAAVRELMDYVRSFGIEPIPEIQSLGHVQFMTFSHPEIAEIPVEDEAEKIDIRAEDQRPEKLYPHCYCPSNERSYEILFDLADEIIEVFQPKEYVHFGHDEVYEIGVCKVCREKDPAELFAADVNRLYDYLKKKGLKMMIWADMLQRPERYRTTAAIDKIPKDILMLDFIWYFYMDRDIETNLLEHGFKVAIGNLYSSHFPRYCSRIARKGMVGGQISAWVGTDLRSLVQEGKLFDFFLTAQMLWSKDYNPCCTHAYDRQITARMPWLKNKLEGIALPSHAEKAKRRLLLEQPLADAPVKELALEGEAKSILLCHTLLYHVTKKPWKAPSKVGEYLLTFADGTEQRIPLTAGGNIGHWNRYQHQPNLHELYRHTGYSTIYDCEGIHSKTPAGEPICLYQIEVLTEKPLRSVRLIEEPDAQIALCRIEVVT